MDKLLLTAQEAGAVLSIGRTKVYELMEAGLLESVTIGRCRRVPAEALVPFVEALRQGPGQARHPSARIGTRWSCTPTAGSRPTLSNECAEEVLGSTTGSGS
jgi:excisionase family DNA binding protein